VRLKDTFSFLTEGRISLRRTSSTASVEVFDNREPVEQDLRLRRILFHQIGVGRPHVFTDRRTACPSSRRSVARARLLRRVPTLEIGVMSRFASPRMSRPNGIAFHLTKKNVYSVANSDPQRAIWMAFPVNADACSPRPRVATYRDA